MDTSVASGIIEEETLREWPILLTKTVYRIVPDTVRREVKITSVYNMEDNVSAEIPSVDTVPQETVT